MAILFLGEIRFLKLIILLEKLSQDRQKADKIVSSTGLVHHIGINLANTYEQNQLGVAGGSPPPQTKGFYREEMYCLSGFDSQFSAEECPSHHLFALKVLVLYITTHCQNR